MNNPAITLYRTWKQLIDLYNPTDEYQTRVVLGARDRGVYATGLDGANQPILSYSHIGGYWHRANRGFLQGDFNLWADGSFAINYYDHDFKHVCDHSFLGWDRVAGERVVFFAPTGTHPNVDPDDYEYPVAYFRWGSIPTRTRMHLVEDDGSWTIAIHPEAKDHAERSRLLNQEYEIAARRYGRAAKRDEPPPVSNRYAAEIDAISLLLEPYRPARQAQRPKEKAHDKMDAHRTK